MRSLLTLLQLAVIPLPGFLQADELSSVERAQLLWNGLMTLSAHSMARLQGELSNGKRHEIAFAAKMYVKKPSGEFKKISVLRQMVPVVVFTAEPKLPEGIIPEREDSICTLRIGEGAAGRKFSKELDGFRFAVASNVIPNINMPARIAKEIAENICSIAKDLHKSGVTHTGFCSEGWGDGADGYWQRLFECFECEYSRQRGSKDSRAPAVLLYEPGKFERHPGRSVGMARLPGVGLPLKNNEALVEALQYRSGRIVISVYRLGPPLKLYEVDFTEMGVVDEFESVVMRGKWWDDNGEAWVKSVVKSILYRWRMGGVYKLIFHGDQNGITTMFDIEKQGIVARGNIEGCDMWIVAPGRIEEGLYVEFKQRRPLLVQKVHVRDERDEVRQGSSFIDRIPIVVHRLEPVAQGELVLFHGLGN